MAILDSGNRTEFATGAVRDMREGKGRMDLMPLGVVEYILNDESLVLHGIRNFMEENDTRYLYFALASFATVAYDNCRETMVLEVGKHFEEGAKKYGENNWQKGIEPKYYIDSAIRHYLKWRRGDKDEPHDRAFVWNIMCCIWEVDWHKKEEKEEKEDIPDSLPIDDYDAPVNVKPYKITKKRIEKCLVAVVKETNRTCETCKYARCDNCRYYCNWAPKEAATNGQE